MMTSQWIKESIFYHIYPLGLCGAPEWNSLSSPVANRLEELIPWLDHIQSLGANAIYLGPVFESSSHGYDTIDYYQVDRRLGNNDALKLFSDEAHQRGLRLVLDGVFNHVGRDFWAFKDVQQLGEDSAYCGWFHNLSFNEVSPMGDPFNYESWQGHYRLVKLNLSHPHVRAHLFDAVAMWMEQFNIEGLRLDAADSIDLDFLRALHNFTKLKRPDFYLLGEVVHGNYRDWVNPETLDSVTNYQCYKGLYSSLVEANYFEIAYGINRQFGADGIYKDLCLYNFVDNHDVDRAASKFDSPAMLYPLYLLLFTMPGIPSVYYGSEWGIGGVKGQWTDAPLRPALELPQLCSSTMKADLLKAIQGLAELRTSSPAIKYGDYKELFVDNQQFAFLRQFEGQKIVIALNSSSCSVDLTLDLPWETGNLVDLLSPETRIDVNKGSVKLALSATWGRVLSYEP
ncbi:MAG: alpha-amylase family glycosyl hydrolase [Chloroflexota bacterium]|nr:alpha-amylase family glycosyl hydrolase [Chloroflexota bacterium]